MGGRERFFTWLKDIFNKPVGEPHTDVVFETEVIFCRVSLRNKSMLYNAQKLNFIICSFASRLK